MNKLVIVLGMHRSGTSAVTRALTVLGVDLGSYLIESQEDNPKGFWEDSEMLSFNERLMRAVGMEWDCLRPIRQHEIEQLKCQGFLLEALSLLKRKTQNKIVFGFKDPRFTKMLPFWVSVLPYLGVKIYFLIAKRNPLDVVRSLKKRNEIPHTFGYLMWLEYMSSALRYTIDYPRMIVDYNELLENPVSEVNRIADFLGQVVNSDLLSEYSAVYIDFDLRHSHSTEKDLWLDPTCLPIVAELFSALGDVDGLESQALADILKGQGDEWARVMPLIEAIDRYRVSSVKFSVESSQKKIVELGGDILSLRGVLENEVREKNEVLDKIAAIEVQAQEYVERIQYLQQVIAERDTEVNSLRHQVLRHTQPAA
ncbi:MAG TPA: sulfotransferase domain-containing protein [Burkholderiaceae bacterium]|nr:sulfotransferase domain-containing protein [Burkholderiaceae bacterium]